MLTLSSLRQMTLKANMASLITDTDDMKGQCTLWVYEFKSVVIIRRQFRSKYPHGRNNIPSRNIIRTLYSRLTETAHINIGNVHRRRTAVGPLIVEAISNIYQENSSTSIRQDQVTICKTSVHKAVRKKIKLYPYRLCNL